MVMFTQLQVRQSRGSRSSGHFPFSRDSARAEFFHFLLLNFFLSLFSFFSSSPTQCEWESLHSVFSCIQFAAGRCEAL